MPDGLISAFKWSTHRGGYRVVVAAPKRKVSVRSAALEWINEKREYVVPSNAGEPPESMVVTSPMKHETLVHEFSKIVGAGGKAHTEGVLKFVNRFGLLWHWDVPVLEAQHEFINPFFGNDPRGDREFRYANDVAVIAFEAIAVKEVLDIWSGRKRFKKPEDRARFAAQGINSALNKIGGYDVQIARHGVDLELVTRPRSLLAAIWSQLATDVSKNASVLQCVTCKQIFFSRAKARGNPRKYCSERCAKAAQRAKRG